MLVEVQCGETERDFVFELGREALLDNIVTALAVEILERDGVALQKVARVCFARKGKTDAHIQVISVDGWKFVARLLTLWHKCDSIEAAKIVSAGTCSDLPSREDCVASGEWESCCFSEALRDKRATRDSPSVTSP